MPSGASRARAWPPGRPDSRPSGRRPHPVVNATRRRTLGLLAGALALLASTPAAEAARTLGLAMPQSLILRADRVIE